MKKALEETVRTFVAVEFPQEIQERLQETQDALRQRMPDVRWTKYGNIHLTLKFLGDARTSKIDAISRALSGVAGQFSPFAISLAGLGVFPNSRRPRIVWVGVEKGSANIVEIAAAIEAPLKKLGFPRERRRPSPHLTVGRIRHLKDPLAMMKALERSEIGMVGEFIVERVSLIKSQLDPGGSVYTTLAQAPLEHARKQPQIPEMPCRI